MAAARKKYKPRGNPRPDEPALYGEFIADLLGGAHAARKLVESRTGNGRLELEYEDDGPGQQRRATKPR